MNASRMMARMTTTNQKKNTAIPGMAYPATVLALATASSYPAPPGVSAAGVGSTTPDPRAWTWSPGAGVRLSQLHRQLPNVFLIRPEHRKHGNRDTCPDIV